MDRRVLADTAAFRKIDPPCPYFGTCGGCSLQDLDYRDQLALKRQRLLRLLGTVDPSLTLELVPSEDPWRYRNKAELTFGGGGLGYHAARSFWRIVDLNDCLLLPEPASRLISDVRHLAQQTGVPAYNPKTHQGFFRYLLIRHSRATNRLLVCLITLPGERTLIESLAEALRRAHPEISSVYWGTTTKVADVAAPEELVLIRGDAYLEDRVGPFAISLHPLTFLQPTTAQAERMYEQISRWVNASPQDSPLRSPADGGTKQGIAWDVYCGIGLIAFYLASSFRTVYAIDSEVLNLEMARLNAQANGITNVQWHHGRAEEVLRNTRFWIGEAQPEVVVVDPPRSGLHPRVIGSLLAARPKQLIYLSCNAQALARDLTQLLNGFPRYRLREVTAFDVFPHTPHVEVAALLERS